MQEEGIYMSMRSLRWRSLLALVPASALALVSGLAMQASAEGVAGAGEQFAVRISKIAEDNVSAGLEGASLTLTSAGREPQTWDTSSVPHEIALAPGTYTLTETAPPQGYDVAEPITFEVVPGGTVNASPEVLGYTSKDSNPVRAYTDQNDDSVHWGSSPYGKNYYVDRDTANTSAEKDEVIYCFNMDLRQPPDSSDYGGEIDPDISSMKPVNFATRYVSDGLMLYAATPKVHDPALLALKLRKVVDAGYPNDKKNFGAGLTPTEFRAATQLAVYYWSDSFTLDRIREIVKTEGKDSPKTHGFGRIDEPEGQKVKDVYEKLIEYAEDSATDSDITDKNIGIYIPNLANYQRFISSKEIPQERVPVITMVDKKTVTPDTPQPEAKVEESEAKDPRRDCAKKEVTETFTVTTTPYMWDAASKTWVLDAAKAVVKDETRTRAMNDAELQECTPQPETTPKTRSLAFTGANTSALGALGALMLALGGSALFVRRRSKN
ncbi:MAG: Cys-Gln thioester bond-forming surface protein [Schaalia hyovaginalis]|uniref:Cys-Gln thioester bond-forming surface protein n=2 Tax=Schaalia hyovaginalis TaxID=29316 RepID=UPI0023F7AA4B|nr:Cys-Gln thioester bond-forming surface protein [Schaalia hyovaginalis]MDY5506424.1 Cys-Gln thioester bond-forming surface protein [Schaalia hyovaginalis]